MKKQNYINLTLHLQYNIRAKGNEIKELYVTEGVYL